MSSYSEWKESVTEQVAEELEISYSDAAGLVEAQPFYMQQSWGAGLNVQLTSAKIIGVKTH